MWTCDLQSRPRFAVRGCGGSDLWSEVLNGRREKLRGAKALSDPTRVSGLKATAPTEDDAYGNKPVFSKLLDAQLTTRKEEGASGADDGEDRGRVLGGVDASVLREEARDGDKEEKGCTYEQKGRFLHGVLKLEGTVCPGLCQ